MTPWDGTSSPRVQYVDPVSSSLAPLVLVHGAAQIFDLAVEQGVGPMRHDDASEGPSDLGLALGI